MSAIACQLFRIKFPQQYALKIISRLELSNSFEPIEPIIPFQTNRYQTELKQLNLYKDQLSTAINTLSNHLPKKFKKLKPLLTNKTVKSLITKKQQLLSQAEQVQEKSNLKSKLEKRLAEINQEIDKLAPYQEINTPIFTTTELISTKAIEIPTSSLPVIRRSLKEIDLLSFYKVSQNPEITLLLLTYTPEFDKAVTSLLTSQKLTPLTPPHFVTADNPKDAHIQLTKLRTELTKKRDQLVEELTEIATQHLTSLQALFDLYAINIHYRENLKFVGYLPGETTTTNDLSTQEREAITAQLHQPDSLITSLSQHTDAHIDGWMDPENLPSLKAKLHRVNPEITITSIGMDNDPEVRTVLKNNPIFRPFEAITALMGTPSPNEPDPSPYVAPFFIAFFGFALGDAGYGLIMVLAALYAMKKLDDNPQLKDALTLILYCGLATIFFGVITGGWFGANLAEIGAIGTWLAQFKLLDLQSNIILVLIGSLIIGFIHQLFGLALKVQSLTHDHKYQEAIEDPGSWLILLLSLTFSALTRFVPSLTHLASIANITLLVALIIFAFGQGRGTKNIILRPVKGLASLFNLTSYLSNTLSYARLLALALATGVIGSVVNLIAVMFGGDIPIIGPLITILILILGHSFNIALNLLGTFINVARLHLVEFFPRFFEAKGTLLNPLKIHTLYAKVSKDIKPGRLMAITKA